MIGGRQSPWGSASMRTNATRHGRSLRLAHAWFVPRWIRRRPAPAGTRPRPAAPRSRPRARSRSRASGSCGTRSAAARRRRCARRRAPPRRRSRGTADRCRRPRSGCRAGSPRRAGWLPPAGGSIGGTVPAGAVSPLPALEAGMRSVIQRTRATRSGTQAGALLCGDGPSLTMIERPWSSWPVTTRRTGPSSGTSPSSGRSAASWSPITPPPRTGSRAARATTGTARSAR